MMRVLRWVALGSAIAIAALVVASADRFIWYQMLQTSGSDLRLDIARGQSLGGVLALMESKGIVRYPRFLAVRARWLGLDKRIKAGEYAVEPGMLWPDLLHKLTVGEVITYGVTIPEGWSFDEMLTHLGAQEALRADIVRLSDPRLQEIISPQEHPEGLFMPETYRYTRGDAVSDILRRARDAQQQLLDRLWQSRDRSLPLSTPYDALILASIIEKETGVPEERGAIAGVFLRRLERKMRLQTDPTVIYGLGKAFDGNLTRAHLRDSANRFNTYRHDGLPPTPIGLPGADALRAVFAAEKGDSLYFVARGDGTHAFSATLEEHNDNVGRFQLSR